MEGLDHGWKRSIFRYHYYEEGSQISSCNLTSYIDSIYKDHQFLTENELTKEMDVCKVCYRIRQHTIMKIIVESKKDNGFWDDTRKCPNCKSRVIFWNQNKDKSHTCTLCNQVVTL